MQVFCKCRSPSSWHCALDEVLHVSWAVNDYAVALAVRHHVAVHHQGVWNVGTDTGHESWPKDCPRQLQADLELPCRCSQGVAHLCGHPPNRAVLTALQASVVCI